MTETKIRLAAEGGFPIHDLAGLVPLASAAEQAALTLDISDNQQKEPIVLWKGDVIDGRCRQQALTTLGFNIMYKELSDDLTEEEVSVYVKSVNTRRNLTHTQKTISACRQSLKPNSPKILDIAKAWSISKNLLENARVIAKEYPEFIEPLFNGGSVEIISADGNIVSSNKISTIYAFIAREKDKATKDEEYGWSEDATILSHKGKEWYYEQVKIKKITDPAIKIMIAELANYKHETVEQAIVRVNRLKETQPS